MVSAGLVGGAAIAETTTDLAGRFAIDLSALEASHAGATFTLEVYEGLSQLETHGATTWSFATDAQDLVVCVVRPVPCETPSEAPPPGVNISLDGVHGIVRHVDGTPLVNLSVSLWEVTFNGETQVTAPVNTQAGGWFAFGAVTPSRDLYVKVTQPGSPPRLVGTSKVSYGWSGGPLRFRIFICDDALRRPSEFARVSEDLSRRIFPSSGTHPDPGLPAALLGMDVRKVAWISGKSRWSLDRVTDRVMAERLAQALSAPGFPVGVEALYGLLREGFPKTTKEILSRPPSQVGAALARARSGNVIGLNVSVQSTLDALLLALGRTLDGGGADALGAILRASQTLGQPQALSNPDIASFCQLFAGFSGTDEALWAAAAGLAGWTAAKVNEAKRLVRLGTIGLGHGPTVVGILRVLGPAPADVVGSWTAAIWGGVAGAPSPGPNAVNPLPAGLQGATDSERRTNLSQILQEQAALAFPGRAFHQALSTGSAGVALGVNAVLSQSANAAVDLRTARLYAGTPDVPVHLPADIEPLRRAQRLVRITPTISANTAIQKLVSLGISSARDVVRRGRTRFVEAYAAGNPALEAEAQEVVARAESQVGMAESFFLSAHPALGRAALSFVPQKTITVAEDDIPGWSGLFTMPAGTNRGWCDSIHGPSAYLVDLLHWLSSRTPPTTYASTSTPAWTSALDALLARRPDLADLPLTCENAERMLPAIDLTLEVLEGVVAGVGLASARSSEAASADMLAAPQYTVDAAYDAAALGNHIRSFSAPFHQPLAVARPHLAHLGIARTDLMRAFGSTAAAVAMEELGLSLEGAAAITEVDVEQRWWSFPIPPAAPSDVTVKVFRRAAGVSLEQILDMLHTRLVNPARGVNELRLVLEAGGDPYDVAAYSIRRVDTALPTYTAPTEAQFTAMRKALRLSAATGWTLLELDRVCAALGVSDPAAWGEQTLTELSDVHRLGSLTGLDPVELSGWFGSPATPHGRLDTFGDRDTQERPSPSLYDRTWLNPSLFPLSTHADSPLALLPTRDDVAVVSPLRNHIAKLCAVLQVDDAEARQLIDALESAGAIEQYDPTPGVPGTAPVAALNLRNLGLLYRWSVLARLMRIPPADLLRVAELMGVAPAASDAGPFASPATAIDFLERVRRLFDARWSVDELDYLVRDAGRERVGPTDDWLRGVLGRLRDAARALKSTSNSEDRLDRFAEQLAQEFGVKASSMADLDKRMFLGAAHNASDDYLFIAGDTVANSSGVAVLAAAVQVVLAHDVGHSTGTIPSGTTITVPAATVVNGPIQLPTGLACSAPADGVLTIEALSTTIAAGASLVVPAGTVVAWGQSSSGTLLAAADGRLLAEAPLATIPLFTFADPSDVVSTRLVSRFLRSGFTAEAVTAPNDPWSDIHRDAPAWRDDFAVLDALHKAFHLQARLGADADERTAWVGRAADLSLLDPATLTSASTTLRFPMGGFSAAFASLENTIALFRLRERLPGATPSFAQIIEAPTAVNLAERTGWSEAALSTLVGAGIVSVSDLESVLTRMEFVRRAGAAVEVVQGWAVPGSLTSFSPAKAEQIVGAARSKHPDAQTWSRVARGLRDPVRKSQRDALVSYLIAENAFAGGPLETAEDLYEHYLIDVSMNPEALTSRIVQATMAVQLFVHRSLFGLERDDTGADLGSWFNDEDRAEWEWMRTYRVWEAARKVFLYPENWIEPELRDEKTPFFTALEQSLAQGDVTVARVEQIALNYLDRLRAISSLKVLACHHETGSVGDGGTDRFHVFARSRSEPASYWYRRREAAATWTPWEEVKTGLQGDHLVPVVHNRRLILFWAEFAHALSPESEVRPSGWWEIRLAMSEFRDGGWSPKEVSQASLALNTSWVSDLGLANAPLTSYGFVSAIDGDGGVTVRCIAERPAGAASRWSVFHELGRFTINPCTQEISPIPNRVQTPAPRIALDPTRWVAPGYTNAVPIINDDDPDDLDVYLGAVDEAGKPLWPASPVDVLGRIRSASVVVPSQFQDFVSQSPFFVSVGERVYFVEPGRRPAEVLEATAKSGVPPIEGLSSFRNGTYAAAEPPSGLPLTDSQVNELTVFVDGASVRSAEAAASAVRAVDTSLRAFAPAASVTGLLGTYRFWSFYHPFACRFIKEVRRDGIFALLDPDPEGSGSALFRQVLAGDAADFETRYQPTVAVDLPYPQEDIDFSISGAYSPYNWEIFFHLPYYVASRLADAGKYQEAVAWFHTIFDPRTRTRASASGFDHAVANADWWKVKPLLAPASRPVTDWIAFTGAAGDPDAQAEFEAQVAAWREDPFNPHALARLRPGTYQRAIVMRYVDTLVAWGDALFGRDTLESINEATQLYVFARQVLGDRPELLGEAERPPAKTWDDLKASLDDFSNPLVALENAAFSARGLGRSRGGSAVLSGVGFTTYFCVPFNAKLLSYWDTIDDRLFKIRNGMNIAGVVRSLPLFQPPIDPAMLVRAAAAGIDIGAALSDAAGVGHYRFSVMIGRAQALAGSVRSLGQALLSALDRRDAEALAVLRQTHEGALLDAVKGVRERQVEEAKENLAALRKNRRVVEARHRYYDRLIDRGWIGQETAAATAFAVGSIAGNLGANIEGIKAIVARLPDITAGPAAGATTGGGRQGEGAKGLADGAGKLGAVLLASSSFLTTTASYKRREEEWKNQRNLAEKELGAIDKQIVAAEIRADVAKRELSNHELQIRHSEEVREWMESKFTNAALYDWMVGQLATLYFQSWQLAYTTAKKAEACYQHELGRDDSFVQAVHWDGTKKGLLAGERLQLDLERMDAAYLDHDAREHELTKHVSLRLLDPVAVERLKVDGECYFVLPEALFDLDHASHYLRRILSVALSVACVPGPQGNVNLQLTLHSSAIRSAAGTSGDPVVEDWNDHPSIATSVATQDAGLFSADPRDPRYLPFERRGAVSTWHLRITSASSLRQLDWTSIEDVVLHMRYTARDGGTAAIRTPDLNDLRVGLEGASSAGIGNGGFVRIVSARRDAPDDLAAAQDAVDTALTLAVTQDQLDPAGTGTMANTLTGALVIPVVSSNGVAPSTVNGVTLVTVGGLSYAALTTLPTVPGDVTLTLGGTGADYADLDDMVLVLLFDEG